MIKNIIKLLILFIVKGYGCATKEFNRHEIHFNNSNFLDKEYLYKKFIKIFNENVKYEN